MQYTKEQKQEFVELAQQVGIQGARRELGYPSSWRNGRRWCDNAGVVVERDELMQRARAQREFYRDEELLLAAQDLIDKAQELMKQPGLTAAELEKLSAVVKRAIADVRNIQGKNVVVDSETDRNIANLLEKFESNNQQERAAK